jgi:hypothetical protein
MPIQKYVIHGVLVWGALHSAAICQEKNEAKKPTKSLEEAYAEFHKGMQSQNKEDRVKALGQFLPTKEDIEQLFPKHHGELWKALSQSRKALLDKCDDIAKQETRHGTIERIKTEDIRTGKQAKDSYKEVLALIPKDVPVFSLSVQFEKGAAGSETYVYVRDRWIFIKDLDALPEILTKDK